MALVTLNPSAVVDIAGSASKAKPWSPHRWVGARSIRSQLLSFWLAMLLPLTGALALTYQIAQLQTAAEVVGSTHEAIHKGQHLVTLFSEMELAVHAYALTREDMFLERYLRARAGWPEALQAAVGLVQNDQVPAERLGRVERDVNDFLTFWEQKLPAIIPGGDQTAWMLIGEDESRTQRISRTIADFVTGEEHVIRARLNDLERARYRVYVGTVASSAAAVGLFLAFAGIFTRSIARPIQRVVAAATRFGAGHLDERVAPRGGQEARVLATAFNRMAESLQQAQAALDGRNRELERTSARLATANEDLLERQRETDDFLYVLSHDLRAPLINIQGFGKRLHTSMAALDQRLADVPAVVEGRSLLSRMGESLKFVNAGAAKIDQLITRLLEIARLTTRGNPHQWVDTHVLVRDVIGACRFQLEERGVSTEIGTLPHVFGDPVQLNQVFTNLVDNAIKYIGERPHKRIVVSCIEQGDRYRFAVADTGPGIAPKDREKVFRMFSRLAPSAIPGEGIGLAAVRTIINRHGGRIWVESAPDRGSTFYFTLPREPNGRPAHAEMQTPMAPTRAKESSHAY